MAFSMGLEYSVSSSSLSTAVQSALAESFGLHIHSFLKDPTSRPLDEISVADRPPSSSNPRPATAQSEPPPILNADPTRTAIASAAARLARLREQRIKFREAVDQSAAMGSPAVFIKEKQFRNADILPSLLETCSLYDSRVLASWAVGIPSPAEHAKGSWSAKDYRLRFREVQADGDNSIVKYDHSTLQHKFATSFKDAAHSLLAGNGIATLFSISEPLLRDALIMLSTVPPALDLVAGVGSQPHQCRRAKIRHRAPFQGPCGQVRLATRHRPKLSTRRPG